MLAITIAGRIQGNVYVTTQIDEVTYRVENQKRIMLVHVQKMLPYGQWKENGV
jgi:hypothetical protein